MKSTIEHPKVFISYAWASEDYRLKVRSFATDLMGNGIDVLLDHLNEKLNSGFGPNARVNSI